MDGDLPAFGSAVNYGANLTQAVGNLAPLATSYHGAETGVQTQNSVIPTTPSGGGNLSKFENFIGSVGSETGHLAGQAASWLGKNVVNMAEAPYKLGEGIGHGIVDRLNLDSVSSQNDKLSESQDNLSQQYKSGTITTKQYQAGLKELNEESTNLIGQTKSLSNQVNFDQKASTQALINTASDLVTILTAGFGKAVATGVNITGAQLSLDPIVAKTATDFLASKAAAPFLDSASDFISRVASQPEVYKALDAGTQELLQRSTAEVVANADASLTAGQIARATAANVALKYPLFYNYTSSTASSIYQELDQGKYGDAVRSLALNAAMLLSGGPIEQALKYGGKAVAGASARVFGQTSFWDELSKFYGDQSPEGFTNAITKIAGNISDDGERQEFIKNLSAVEATNVSAVGGDASAAAYRVAKAMQGEYSVNLSEISHEDGINDMVKFSKNFRLASQTAEDNDLPQVVVGRLDARDKQSIVGSLMNADDTQGRLDAWESWKDTNPNSAAANNTNFDRQIKSLIGKHDDMQSLGQSILDIKARTTAEGFPQAVLDKMAKDGYIPIRPKNIEAPFQEGGDKLLTNTAGAAEDYFTRAVQPLPVLGSVGALLTNMGLSPEASSQRVYQMFNDNLARNLGDTRAADKFETGVTGAARSLDSDELTKSDLMLKQLSDYAHGLKVPETDLRMMTTKQIGKALDVSAEDAKEVQNAIAQAHIQIPLAVRGLGDRAVDWAYKLPASAPVMRRYLRLQGALRFSFNPFFQYLRVIPKTEILTEAKGGGYLSSIFMGRTSEIDNIRTAMRQIGALDKDAGTIREANVFSNEGVSEAESGASNLGKKLLPMQERSIAGLVDAQAQRMGMDWKQYMSLYPDQVKDTVQAVAQYDRKANFLNSPMARTLNVAFFPFRFDAKVAGVMAKGLARQDLVTQVATVNGLLKAHDWLNSPEGQAWYSKNSDAIGVFNYITPLASMTEAMTSLFPGHNHSLGNFGEIGGLPFGWIPQLLDSEGLTHFNQPAVDASTGATIPEYIPKTLKGQAAVAIQDFLGSLFSYPGATAGLPSKTSMTRDFAIGAVGANKKTDFNLVTPQISNQQKSYQQIVQNLNGTTPTQQQQSATVQDTPFNTNVPAQPTNATTPVPKSTTSSTKKKKADFTPALLPGQSQLGVLPS